MVELTDRETALIARLPQPKTRTSFRANKVWIVEWLPSSDFKTGHALHIWLNEKRPGWSTYRSCDTKSQVIEAIEEAARQARDIGMSPILQLEAHGHADHEGLILPTTEELLSWEELTEPLQHLNFATGCNLVMLVAACTGVAGLKAMAQGPRAPALAVIGPVQSLNDEQVRIASKQFYLGLLEGPPVHLQTLVDRMSAAIGIEFHCEPFTDLNYQTLLDNLVESVRPENWKMRESRMREALAGLALSQQEIDRRILDFPLVLASSYQQAWDVMFMIDRYPENQERFGFDVRAVVLDVMKEAGLI